MICASSYRVTVGGVAPADGCCGQVASKPWASSRSIRSWKWAALCQAPWTMRMVDLLLSASDAIARREEQYFKGGGKGFASKELMQSGIINQMAWR